MGFLLSEAFVDIKARDAKLASDLSQAKGTVTRAAADMDRKLSLRPKLDDGALKDSINKLKGSFGKSSDLGQLGKILSGGGAIFGLTIIGRELGRATEAAAKLKKEFADGEVSAAGMAQGLMEGLPIFGEFARAGKNIRELFSGEQAAIDGINAEAKGTGIIVDAQLAGLRAAKGAAEQLAGTIRDIREQAALVRLDGLAKDLAQIGFQGDSAFRSIERQAAESVEKIRSAYRPALDQINKDLSKPPAEDDQSGRATFAGRQSQKQGLLREQAREIAEVEAGKRQAMTEQRAVTASEQSAAVEREQADNAAKVRRAAEAAERDLGRTTARAREQALRNAGRPFDADLASIREKLSERLAEIKKATAEESALFAAADRENQSRVADRGGQREAAAKAEAQADIEHAKQEAADAAAEATNRADEAAASAEEKRFEAAERAARATDEVTGQIRRQRQEAEHLGQSFSALSDRWKQFTTGGRGRQARARGGELEAERDDFAGRLNELRAGQGREENAAQSSIDSAPEGSKVREVRERELERLKERHARERQPLERALQDNAKDLAGVFKDLLPDIPAAAVARAKAGSDGGDDAAKVAAASSRKLVDLQTLNNQMMKELLRLMPLVGSVH